jgi:hypothetical protein
MGDIASVTSGALTTVGINLAHHSLAHQLGRSISTHNFPNELVTRHTLKAQVSLHNL